MPKMKQKTISMNHSPTLNSVLMVEEVLKDAGELGGIGHRVVHGGEAFREPTLLTPEVLDVIRKQFALAPLHNPPNLLGINVTLEACPNVNDSSRFMGPASINQVRYFNMHPTGKFHRSERLEAMMQKGGVAECGKAQNCVEVCPKGIPLIDSIGAVARDTTKHMIFRWLLG